MARNIHIENLQIRLKNVQPEQARGVGKDLGGEILRSVADVRQSGGGKRIEKLDGTIRNNGGAADLQKQIAGKIARLIGGHKT